VIEGWVMAVAEDENRGSFAMPRRPVFGNDLTSLLPNAGVRKEIRPETASRRIEGQASFDDAAEHALTKSA